MRDQKKLGLSISYLNLAIGTAVNIFLTPFIIRMLGDNEYSIYKVMQSFAGPLVMFNLGVSTIVTRAIVKYETLDEHNLKEKQNTIALAMITSAVMALLVLVIGCVMCFIIPTVYGKSYSDEMVKEGQIIFCAFVLATVFHILTDAFNGCAVGHERFAFNSSMSLLKNVLRIPLIILVLKLGLNAVAVTCVDCAIAIVIFMISAGYSLFVLKERPKLTHAEKKELFDMFSFSAAILLQTVVNQVNNNVDTILLGAMVAEKRIIAMYSSALIIYNAYNSIVSVMTSFFLPKATRLVSKNASGEELTDFVIKPGRYQAMIAVAIVFGFAVLGRDFISVWIGSQYSEAYYIVLMLIIPVTIPLVENSAISILDATLKRIFRSVVLAIMAALNVALSVVLIKFIGFWGAAVGTLASLLVGHGILMNAYYARTFHMNIGRMFASIFKGILPMGMIAALVCAPLMLWKTDRVLYFLIKCVAFVLVYGFLVWKWGIKTEERNYIKQSLHIR